MACVMVAFTTSVADAQNVATVRGTVTDAATGRPVIGAIVRLGPVGAERSTRSDASGAFVIANMPVGVYPFDVRRIGYEVSRHMLDVTTYITPLAVQLTRLATLDTVQVRAAKQGLFGVVATATDLRPLPNARLRIVGLGAGYVTLDSTAHFFVPVKLLGSYVLRATAPGYMEQTISVLVAPNEGVEVAFLLDSAANGVSHKLDMPYMEFNERIIRRGIYSTLVPRTELLKNPKTQLVNAVRSSPSFAARAMRWDASACVYVDGYPRPGMSLNDIDVEDVEAVEVYNGVPGARRLGDRTGSLANGWPRSGNCGDTGQPRPASRGQPDDIIKWVVIWLKH